MAGSRAPPLLRKHLDRDTRAREEVRWTGMKGTSPPSSPGVKVRKDTAPRRWRVPVLLRPPPPGGATGAATLRQKLRKQWTERDPGDLEGPAHQPRAPGLRPRELLPSLLHAAPHRGSTRNPGPSRGGGLLWAGQRGLERSRGSWTGTGTETTTALLDRAGLRPSRGTAGPGPEARG